MDDDIEQYILDEKIDIFFHSEYICDCTKEFLIKQALKVVKNEPSRIAEIVDKIRDNSSYDHEEIFWEFNKYRDEFLNYICDENFVLNSNNERALFYLPHLYLKSLQNDYKHTINYKCYAYLPNPNFFMDVIIDDVEMFNEYYFTLIKNGYCISDDVEHPLFISPVMFLASLDYDRKATYAKCGLFFNFFSENAKKFVYKKGFVDYYQEESQLLPQFIVENSFALKEILKNDKKVELATRILSRESYKNLDEEEILKVFNVENSSIDEFMVNLCDKKLYKTIKTLTFEEKILVTFYTKKLLYSEGVENYKVALFSYTTNSLKGREPRGQLLSKTLHVFIPNNDDTIRSMLTTIVHETMHAKQDLAIENMDFKSDSDIDIYSKEYVLGLILKDEYYKTNYNYVSYEEDANFKMEIKVAKILNEFDELFETYRVIGEKELLKNNKYLENVRLKNGSHFTMNRLFKGEKYHLDDLFIMVCNMYIRSGGNLQEAIDKYPLIGYEFDVDGYGVQKRSIKNLAMRASNSSNSDRKIYLKLIEQALDKRKNKDYLNNRNELKECLKYQTKEVKEELEKLLSTKHNRLNKYKSLNI